MANLNNKVFEFRRHFDITDDFKDDQVFKLDPRGNLITMWNNKDYYLTNKRNPAKFLSVSTMQNFSKFLKTRNAIKYMEYRFFAYIFVKGKHKTRRDVSGLK